MTYGSVNADSRRIHQLQRLWADEQVKNDALAARIEAVRALHTQRGVTNCDGCNRAWPCPTLVAIS